MNPSPSSWKRQLKQLLCQSWQTKTNMGIWQTDEGDTWEREKRRKEKKKRRQWEWSAALLVTSCLYCRLRGIVVITPLTESSARSGLPSSLPPTPLLLSHSAAKWFIWLPRHIHRHIGASSYWQRSQTLKTRPPTHTHAHWNIGSWTNILVLYFTYPCSCDRTLTTINLQSLILACLIENMNFIFILVQVLILKPESWNQQAQIHSNVY